MPGSVRMSPTTAWARPLAPSIERIVRVGLAGLEPVHEDRRALGRQDPRDPGTRPPVRTGHQRHLAVEPEIHPASLAARATIRRERAADR